MSNPSQWVLVKRFAGVIWYSEESACHENMTELWKGNRFMAFDARDSHKHYRQGGAA
ncbi:MAG: hypothetical protein Q7K57_50025 [Burkholderiaceae bacterium]|uniref:KTSC domain-containing protein n=1 Tax=Polaromonas aquatica TaxID=332657 RepID=A0ABW1U4A9_9BURK|nr:hypothetical protein [Burkholderiaceae bacterium]